MTESKATHAAFYAILIASSATLLFAAPLPVRVFFGLIQTYYLPGFVFLLYCGKKDWPRLDDIFLPLVISPVLISAFVLLCYRITGSLPTAIRLSLTVFYLLLVVSLIRRAARPRESRMDIPRSILLISAAAGAVVICSYIANRYLLVYTDAWHHASVTYEILDRGIPPLEPRFPDVAIRYMWIYHLFQAIVLERSGLDVFVVLGIFNIAVAFTFPYLVARATILFTRERRYILATPVFAFAGLQAASWILWPIFIVRSFFGEVRGMDEILRNLRGIEWDGANVIYFLTPSFTWLMNLMDKFLTITAMNYALNLFLLCFIGVAASVGAERFRFRDAVMIFIAAIGCFLFHVVIGLSLIIGAVGAGILLYVTERLIYKRTSPTSQSLGISLIALAAFIAGLPYFASLAGGEGSGDLIRDHVHFAYRNLTSIVAPLVALLPFSIRAIRDLFTARDRLKLLLLLWILCLTALAGVADLPGIAENKIVFPICMLLVLPVSWRVVDGLAATRGRRRALLSAWIAVLFLVPPVLTVRGFILEKPKKPRYEKRYKLSEAERGLYRWIRDKTEADAVMIEKNTYNLMPVHARRSNFILQPTFIYVHNYGGEKIERYVEIHRNLFSDEEIAEESIRYLRKMPRPCYVVLWSDEMEADPGLRARFSSRPDWFSLVHESGAGIVFKIERDDSSANGKAG